MYKYYWAREFSSGKLTIVRYSLNENDRNYPWDVFSGRESMSERTLRYHYNVIHEIQTIE